MKLNRNYLIEQIAQSWLDGLDMGGLMQFFMDHQIEFLEQQSDCELLISADECGIEVTEVV